MRRSLIWLLIAIGLGVCAVEGVQLRRWVFDAFDPVRFQDDLKRGTFWGLNASGPEGYLNQYSKMDLEVPEWQDNRWMPWLDYSPLRLLVMREWGEWQRKHFPPDANTPLMDAWQRPYEFNAPVMRFNTVLEGFSAILAFLLTRYWVVRGTQVQNRKHFTGVWQGIAAGLFLWFSPDMVINAHGWPQWDTWVVPFYLAACLLASLDWWFAAGAVIAIGLNFKGQMMPVVPIFIIWPLVQRRVGPALRWICGLVFCYALIVSGWLLTYLPPDALAPARRNQDGLSVIDFPPDMFVISRKFDVPAAIWVIEMLIVVAAVPWLLQILGPQTVAPDASKSKFQKFAQSRHVWIAGAMVIMAATIWWPWIIAANRSTWFVGLLLAAITASAGLMLPPRNRLYLLAAIAGGGLFMCMWLFHGDTSWWDCAIHYGSVHWPYLFIGATSNVPAIFQLRFGWPKEIDEIAFTIPAIRAHWPAFIAAHAWWPAVGVDITSKAFFDSIYIVLLILSGIAVGIQTKRNDRRALVAFATPWLMFFLFPVQVQERYLLYGAAVTACAVGESFGMALLGFCLTIFSLMMPFKELLDEGWSDVNAFGENLSHAVPWLFSPQSGETLHQYLDGTQPDIAWGILIIGLIFLYVSLTRSRRSTKQ